MITSSELEGSSTEIRTGQFRRSIGRLGQSRNQFKMGYCEGDDGHEFSALTGIPQLIPKLKGMFAWTMRRRLVRPGILRIGSVAGFGRSDVLQGVGQRLHRINPILEILGARESQCMGDCCQFAAPAIEYCFQEPDESHMRLRGGRDRSAKSTLCPAFQWTFANNEAGGIRGHHRVVIGRIWNGRIATVSTTASGLRS